MSRNRVIGVQNRLPWNLPEDMKFFREKTKGHIMIMGRKTFESFGGKPLPNRLHIVISRSADPDQNAEKVIWVKTVEEAIATANAQLPHYPEEVFVIGGGEIYNASLKHLNRIYLTVIDQDFEGDTKFPEFSLTDFQLTHDSPRPGFTFRTYEKVPVSLCRSDAQEKP